MKITVFAEKTDTVIFYFTENSAAGSAGTTNSDAVTRKKFSVEFCGNMCYNIVKRLKEDLAWEKKKIRASETALNIS